jgi:hypothetical protein
VQSALSGAMPAGCDAQRSRRIRNALTYGRRWTARGEALRNGGETLGPTLRQPEAELPTLDASLSVGSIAAPASAGILQSQLSRYQIQLADWCHCPSGKTADGKRKVADLQTKADATETQLKQVEAVRSRQKVAAPPAVSDSPAPRVGSTVGSLIDVLA